MNYILHKFTTDNVEEIPCAVCLEKYKNYIQRFLKREYIGCPYVFDNMTTIFVKISTDIYAFKYLPSCLYKYNIDYSIYKLCL